MSALFRLLFPALCASLILLAQPARAQQMGATNTAAGTPPVSTNAPAAQLTSTAEASHNFVTSAVKKMNANDPQGSLSDLTQAINLNPNNTGALVLRASIYCQKHQWKQAEDDFNAAAKIAPTNGVIKVQLVEIKFMQKQYDAARPGFVALEKDPDMGDFASYNVFLCDLFGGHEDAAKKELDVFNDTMGNPSYYFANAAWQLVHKNIDGDNGARSWLLSASRIYPVNKFTVYGQPLRDLGYLPIPQPKDQSQ
jgi:tetratricopeptide (TPR) repeat protein